MTIRRGSAHYRLSLAGGGTDLGDGEGLCITLSLPWKCHVTRLDVHEWPVFASVDDADWGTHSVRVDEHPILRHLPNVEPQHHFIVTHEMPTRVGLGSSAALALAACSNLPSAFAMDRKATGAGWQDTWACVVPDGEGYEDFFPCEAMVITRDGRHVLPALSAIEEAFLLFSTGGTHTESRNEPPDERVRALALEEAHRLRDTPTLDTLAWCMQRQWERKKGAPESVKRAISAAAFTSGFMAAKSTGSRGAGFGVVLTKDRERTRDALVECGARVWLV